MELEWYELGRGKRKNTFGLRDKVSVNSGGIGLGSKVVEMFGTELKINVAIAKTKTPSGKEKLTFVLKPDRTEGFKMSKTRTDSYKLNSPSLARWLISKGIKKGWYRLEKIKGGYGHYGYKAVGPVVGKGATEEKREDIRG